MPCGMSSVAKHIEEWAIVRDGVTYNATIHVDKYGSVHISAKVLAKMFEDLGWTRND